MVQNFLFQSFFQCLCIYYFVFWINGVYFSVCPSVILFFWYILFILCLSICYFFWYMLFILLSFLQFFARSQTLSGNFSFCLILKPQKPKPNWKYSTYYLGSVYFIVKTALGANTKSKLLIAKKLHQTSLLTTKSKGWTPPYYDIAGFWRYLVFRSGGKLDSVFLSVFRQCGQFLAETAIGSAVFTTKYPHWLLGYSQSSFCPTQSDTC